MSSVIEVTDVTKNFPTSKSPPGFKEWFLKLITFQRQKRTYFTALDCIRFTIKKGECVGIIGKNGAGKSTLLSLLLGTSFPSSGSIQVQGKRTPLLELGAGFHPDLTGKENIILNGVLLGLTKNEVLERYQTIVQFSEIEPFIDMPVRTYSSGMYLRLAFSVAIHTGPEVLLIDEILAVGDESFQKKSEAALTDLIRSGVTTVFVSHNLNEVKKICNRVIWLHEGRIKMEGDPKTVTDAYSKGTAS